MQSPYNILDTIIFNLFSNFIEAIHKAMSISDMQQITDSLRTKVKI